MKLHEITDEDDFIEKMMKKHPIKTVPAKFLNNEKGLDVKGYLTWVLDTSRIQYEFKDDYGEPEFECYLFTLPPEDDDDFTDEVRDHWHKYVNAVFEDIGEVLTIHHVDWREDDADSGPVFVVKLPEDEDYGD